MTSSSTPSVFHLREAGVSVVIDAPADALPVIAHWGADLGELSDAELREVVAGSVLLRENSLDVPVRVAVVPEPASGWQGAPGLQGHRSGGRDWSPRFTDVRYEADASRVVARGTDAVAGLGLEIELELSASGLLRGRARVENRAGSPYNVDRLAVVFPVAPVASEILDQSGRWSKERVPQRRGIVVGSHVRESRRGRTGADASTVLVAGEKGFGFRSGEVWGVHVGWSGNHLSYVERTNLGVTVIGGGELLLPGEIELADGEAYETPWVYASHAIGLDAQAARFHDFLRARPEHPASDRPVTLNVWEAVYFDHSLAPLLELAERAAEAGIERYVLDDGWFRHRRDDDAGLGDWYVDEGVWPDGLGPLVERVRALGMQFGLWFEPEMINPDSDLAREHPEWIMQTDGRLPLPARNQQVLNVAIPDAYDYLLERLSSLVGEYGIDYIKWDHNRDLLEAGSTARGGAAGVHEQTLAVYRLFSELKGRHPGLEIESCSSGGARVDLGVLEHTDRVWASDCIDPVERQQILRWTAQLLPPELVGSHIGSRRSHTTGRTHDLSFRAITAMFGHYGVEWDITAATEEERRELAGWIELHKRFRPLIRTGRTVRVDHPEAAIQASGVVSPDRAEALFELVMLSRPGTWPVGPVRLPGLDPERRYRVSGVGQEGSARRDAFTPGWMSEGSVVLTGRVLEAVGVQMPQLDPEHAALVHVEAV